MNRLFASVLAGGVGITTMSAVLCAHAARSDGLAAGSPLAGLPCPNPAHACCTSGSAGCSDEACCTNVCAIDPFCCSIVWDSFCVSEAEQLCPNCSGFPVCNNANHGCCLTGDAGCADPSCCSQVCAVDVFCCSQAWDLTCVEEAKAMCRPGDCDDPACENATHTCCTLGGPGCTDAACCNEICDMDPFCCTTEWDYGCLLEANAYCGAVYGAYCKGDCPSSTHDCCAIGEPGCTDAACCSTVCDADPFCCAVAWDSVCVLEAHYDCGASYCSQGACPNPDHDCWSSGTKGCSDATCCAQVCAIDPFCCNNQWDQQCVERALVACGGFVPLTNDSCAQARPIVDGIHAFNTTDATTDGLVLTGCALSGQQIYDDVWFHYTATTTHKVEVSKCSNTFSSRVAVYAGCDCPPTQPPLVCDASPCNQGSIWFNAVLGQCYTIRVGGAAAGGGIGVLSVRSLTFGENCAATFSHFSCFVDSAGFVVGCSDASCSWLVSAMDPFCCKVVWDQICADEAIELCTFVDPCLDCPPGSVVEPEACMEGPGCPLDEASIPTLTCGVPYCGTLWAWKQHRDFDWFAFDVARDNTAVTLEVCAGLSLSLLLFEGGCEDMEVRAASEGYHQAQVKAQLNVGHYLVLLAPTYSDGQACDNPVSKYVLHFACQPPCPADIAPQATPDGTVNIDDLLAVINAWGPCANPNQCPADIAPAGGNDIVNIDDLLAVINAWGVCP